MHITLKDAESLKHSKLDKNAPTCFGLHRNHLQGAKVSAWLKITRLVNSICVKDVQGAVSAMAAYCDSDMLSSIMQNVSSSLCTTIPELLLPGAAESSVSLTKWPTVT